MDLIFIVWQANFRDLSNFFLKEILRENPKN
jgi:hypothetical protein